MYTTNTEGLLNNYAAEPPIYFAEFPSLEQQQRYVFQGVIALLLVTLSILTAFSIS